MTTFFEPYYHERRFSYSAEKEKDGTRKRLSIKSDGTGDARTRAYTTSDTFENHNRWIQAGKKTAVVTTVPPSSALRPPLALSVESPGTHEALFDPHLYQSMVQDVTVLKTLLFRLNGVLQNADTTNPFDAALSTVTEHSDSQTTTIQHLLQQSPAGQDENTCPGETGSVTSDPELIARLQKENTELRDSLERLKLVLAEKDEQIKSLQMKSQRLSQPSHPSELKSAQMPKIEAKTSKTPSVHSRGNTTSGLRSQHVAKATK